MMIAQLRRARHGGRIVSSTDTANGGDRRSEPEQRVRALADPVAEAAPRREARVLVEREDEHGAPPPRPLPRHAVVDLVAMVQHRGARAGRHGLDVALHGLHVLHLARVCGVCADHEDGRHPRTPAVVVVVVPVEKVSLLVRSRKHVAAAQPHVGANRIGDERPHLGHDVLGDKRRQLVRAHRPRPAGIVLVPSGVQDATALRRRLDGGHLLRGQAHRVRDNVHGARGAARGGEVELHREGVLVERDRGGDDGERDQHGGDRGRGSHFVSIRIFVHIIILSLKKK